MKIIKKGQSTILVSAGLKAGTEELKENLEELTELAKAVDLRPLLKMQQSLRQRDPAFLIGSGKQQELQEKVKELKAHYVIFDHLLTGVQTRNLEKLLKVPVLDRTQLILEIFAQRAKSREGKLQVELAQLMDQLPRMVGAWLGSLSRQGGGQGAKGGAGAKGPGEKALETDRRQAQIKIKRIKAKLEKVKQNRSLRRSPRKKKKLASFALIGYTNSGKSTLLNRLTKSRVETKDQLFMTLDPKTRKVFIPGGPPAVITDTVGFIRKLPPSLIEAFKATLEESATADILLHVVDISHPKKNQHIEVVDNLLKELGWSDKSIIYIFNKSDLFFSHKMRIPAHCKNFVWLSAKTGYNAPLLLSKMKQVIKRQAVMKELDFSLSS